MADRRTLLKAGYYGFARWLPGSTWPLGRWFRQARWMTGGRLLDYCGPDANIERGAYLGTGRGVRLGARSGIGVAARLHGPVTIGDDVMMGPDVVFLAVGHGHDDPSVPMIGQANTLAPVTIGDDVWIGTRVLILGGVTIGSGSIIGAGAVVTKDIPPRSVAVGNPATVVRPR